MKKVIISFLALFILFVPVNIMAGVEVVTSGSNDCPCDYPDGSSGEVTEEEAAYLISEGYTIADRKIYAPGEQVDPSNPLKKSNCTAKVAGTFSGCGINVSGPWWNFKAAIDIYGTDGSEIPDLSGVSFTSGRFVGVDAYEEYRKLYYATINPYCTNATLTCAGLFEETTYFWIPPLPPFTTEGRYVPITISVKRYKTITSGTCEEPYPAIASANCKGCAAPSVASCRPEAEQKLNSRVNKDGVSGPSYEGKRQDSNDIYDSNGKETKAVITVSQYGTYDPGEILPKDKNARAIWRTTYVRYKYNVRKTCMNVKTALVRYIDFDKQCDPKNEIEVEDFLSKNNEHVGLYFIPLNALSTNSFVYKLSGIKIQTAQFCKSIINNYKKNDEWKNYILNIKHQQFTSTAEKALKEVEKGCYAQLNLSFNLEQKFYNETKNHTIDGYAFYYKPIDYTRPFPNGLANYKDSYWYGIYNENTNKVTVKDKQKGNITTDLNDSFKNITYSITDIDVNPIRDYNSNYKYTSWQNMDVAGWSNFVKSYITINGKQEYYRLGCGPSNANWEECKK